MQVQKRSLNWLPKASTWASARADAEKRKSGHQTFLDQQSSTANAFQSARDNLSETAAEQAAQTASTRVQAQAKAAVSKLA